MRAAEQGWLAAVLRFISSSGIHHGQRPRPGYEQAGMVCSPGRRSCCRAACDVRCAPCRLFMSCRPNPSWIFNADFTSASISKVCVCWPQAYMHTCVAQCMRARCLQHWWRSQGSSDGTTGGACGQPGSTCCWLVPSFTRLLVTACTCAPCSCRA